MAPVAARAAQSLSKELLAKVTAVAQTRRERSAVGALLREVVRKADAVAREECQAMLRELTNMGLRDEGAQHALLRRLVHIATSAGGHPKPGQIAEVLKLAAEAKLKIVKTAPARAPHVTTDALLAPLTPALVRRMSGAQAVKAFTSIAKLSVVQDTPPALLDDIVAAAQRGVTDDTDTLSTGRPSGASAARSSSSCTSGSPGGRTPAPPPRPVDPTTTSQLIAVYWGCAKGGVRGAAVARLEEYLVKELTQQQQQQQPRQLRPTPATGSSRVDGADVAKFAWSLARAHRRGAGVPAFADDARRHDVVDSVLRRGSALCAAGSLSPLDIAHILWAAAVLRCDVAAGDGDVNAGRVVAMLQALAEFTVEARSEAAGPAVEDEDPFPARGAPPSLPPGGSAGRQAAGDTTAGVDATAALFRLPAQVRGEPAPGTSFKTASPPPQQNQRHPARSHATRLTPQSVTMSLWAATSLMCHAPTAVDALAAAAVAMGDRLDMAGVAVVLWCVQCHDLPLGHRYTPLLRRCAERAGELKGREVVAVVTGAAKSKTHALRSGPAHHMLTTLVRTIAGSPRALGDVGADAVPLLCGAILSLRLRAPDALATIQTHAVAQVAHMHLGSIARLMWSFVRAARGGATPPVAVLDGDASSPPAQRLHDAVARRVREGHGRYMRGDAAAPRSAGAAELADSMTADPVDSALVGARGRTGVAAAGDAGGPAPTEADLLPDAARVLWAYASLKWGTGDGGGGASTAVTAMFDLLRAAAADYAAHPPQYAANALWAVAKLQPPGGSGPALADKLVAALLSHGARVEPTQLAACVDALLTMRHTPSAHLEGVVATARLLHPTDFSNAAVVNMATSFAVAGRGAARGGSGGGGEPDSPAPLVPLLAHLHPGLHVPDLTPLQLASLLWCYSAARGAPVDATTPTVLKRAAMLERAGAFTESELTVVQEGRAAARKAADA